MAAPCYLLRLPNELLVRILEFLFSSLSLYPYEYDDVLSPHIPGMVDSARPGVFCKIAATCRTLKEIAEPFIYRTLCVFSDRPMAEPLHRTLKSRPDLRTHCSQLTFCGAYSPLADDIAKWLSMITELSILGDESGDLLPVTIGHAPHLQILRIINDDQSCEEMPISKTVNAVSAAENMEAFQLLQIRAVSKDFTSKDRTKLKSLKSKGAFTELDVGMFQQTPEVLELLVSWSKTLRKFTFHTAYSSDFGEAGLYTDWTLNTFAPILQMHKSTLTHICIGGLNDEDMADFDVSDFPVLKSLDVTSNATGTQIKFISNLLAPKLKHFRWDLSNEDQQCPEILDDFGEPQELWLRALVKQARERNVPLGSIELEYRPGKCLNKSKNLKELKEIRYPWDRMDQVAQDTGIHLTYSYPSVSEDEFWEEVKSAELKLSGDGVKR